MEPINNSKESPTTLPTPTTPVTGKATPALGQKFDWFLDDLDGKNANPADLYHSGIRPEHLAMHDAEKYWSRPEIQQKFKAQFGEKAKEQFENVYKLSKDRLQAFRQDAYDIDATSTPVFDFRTPAAERLAAAGKGSFSKASPVRKEAPAGGIDPWGRQLLGINRNTRVMSLGPPQHGWRETPNIKVKTPDGRYVTVEEYKKIDPDATFVHAVNEDGSPMVGEDAQNYLRPLAWGEEKRTYEQYWTGDSWNVFGSTGIGTPEWYAAKWLPKNVMNFSADTIDAMAETFKLADNFFQTGVQSDWDKAMTNIQNVTMSKMWGSTSEYGMSDWKTAEGLGDGFAQVGMQLLGMMGVIKGVTGLSRVAKLGAGTRAGSRAALLWMSAIASDDFAKEGREIGLTPKEQATAWGAYMFGMYYLEKLSELVVDPITSGFQVKQAVKKMLIPSLAAAKATSPTKTLALPGIIQAVKSTRAWLDDGLREMMTSPSKLVKYTAAGATEATEEGLQLVWDKGFKTGYNEIYGDYIGSPEYDQLTNRNKDARFKPNWDTFSTELAANLTMGFAGGVFFKFSQSMFERNTPTDRREVLALGAIEGGFEKANRYLDDLWSRDKILPGQKYTDAFGKALEKGKEMSSRSGMAYQAMKAELRMAEQLWNSKNLAMAKPVMADRISYLNEETVARYTSFKKDVTSKLEELDKIQGEMLDNKLSDVQIKAAEARAQVLEKELKDMAEGKYANRYLHEAIFRVDPLVRSRYTEDANSNLDFEQFAKLNAYMTARVTNAAELQGKTPKELLKHILENRTLGYSVEQAKEAVTALDEEYGVISEEMPDGTIKKKLPEGDLGKQYAQKKALIDSMILGPEWTDEQAKVHRILSIDPLDDFYASFTPDGSAGVAFKRQIEVLEKEAMSSMATGTKVFDDTTSISAIASQVIKRIQQAEAMANTNRETNELLSKNGISEKHQTIDLPKKEQIIRQLSEMLGRLQTLYEVALANKGNFYKASQEAADRQRMYTSTMMTSLINAGIREPSYKLFFETLAPDAAALTADTNSDNAFVRLSNLQKKLHDYFQSDAKAAITRFMMMMEEGRISEDEYGYIKAIISQDPKNFYSAYQDVLKGMTADNRTPFPAQLRNSYRIAAHLSGNDNAWEFYNSKRREDGAYPYVVNLNESFFLDLPQGEGKTFIAAVGVAASQKLYGGEAVLFAKRDWVVKKNIAEFERVGAKVKPSPGFNGSFEAIMKFVENKSMMENVRTIVIDEVQQYRKDQIAELDKFIGLFNQQQDPRNRVRLLFLGDSAQYGPMHPDPKHFNLQYHIGDNPGRSIVERGESTGFNFRSGNTDINTVLSHLRSMWLQNMVRNFPEIVVKYNLKNRNGVMMTDDMVGSLKNIVGALGPNSPDYVVIAPPERHSLYTAAGVPSSQIMDVEQAGGGSWKVVFIDQDFDLNKPGGARSNEISKALTAVGRAAEFAVIANKPSYAIRSVEGESIGKENQFSTEEMTRMRTKELTSLENASLPVNPTIDPVINREYTSVTLETVVKTEYADVNTDINEQINKMVASTIGKLPNYALTHTYYNYASSKSADGTVKQLSELEGKKLKKQFFNGPTMPFEADRVSYELRIQRNQFPTQSVYTVAEQEDPAIRHHERMVLYAKFSKGGVEMGELSVGELSVKDLKIPGDPNAVFAIPLKTDETFTALLRSNYAEAASGPNFRNPWKALQKEREQGVNRTKLEKNLDDFIAENPDINFSTKVWHRTTAPVEGAGKAEATPYIFISAKYSPEEMDEILRVEQSSQYEKRPYGTKLRISDQQLDTWQQMGIYGIPIEGGIEYPFTTFLEKMAGDAALPKADRTFYVTYNQERRLRDWLIKTLSPKNPEFDFETKDEFIKSKLFSSNSREDQIRRYLATKVAHSIYPRGMREVTEPTEEKGSWVSRKENKGAFGIKDDTKDYQLYATDLMLSLYEDSIKKDVGEGKDGRMSDVALAKEVLNEISRKLFPDGWWMHSSIIEGSTVERKAPFGASAISRGDYTITNLLNVPRPVMQIPIDAINNALNGSVPSEVNITVEQRPAVKEETKQADIIDADKDPDTGLPIGEYVRKFEGAPDTIEGIQARWFGKGSDFYYLHEFTTYFRNQVYNSVFNLQSETPHIATEESLNDSLSALRRSISQRIKSFQDAGINQSQYAVRGLLRNSRESYYAYVMHYEFDALLKNYVQSIRKDPAGRYRFVSDKFSFNQMSDSGHEVSHIGTGSKMVALHIYNTPFIEVAFGKDKDGNIIKEYVSSRTLNQGDYVRLIRDMQDNDITSREKALAYFSLNGSEPQNDLDRIKRSIYLRFLAPADRLVKVNGATYHSMETAPRNEREMQIAADTVTALISFLASGNVVDYVKVYLHADNQTNTSGRFTGNKMQADFFRADMEASIKGALEMNLEKRVVNSKTPPLAYFSRHDQVATFKFNNGPGNEETLRVRFKNNAYEITVGDTKERPLDPAVIGNFFRHVGLGAIDGKMYDKIVQAPGFGASMYEIAKFFKKEDPSKEIFEGASLFAWEEFSKAIGTVRDIQASQTYNLLGKPGNPVNLVSLSNPVDRTNQKIKEYQTSPVQGPLNVLDIVKGDLGVEGVLLLEGLIVQGTRRSKSVSELTPREFFKFMFRDLYLSSLAKQLKPQHKVNIPFVTRAYADKGMAPAPIFSNNEWLPRHNDVVDIAFLRNRAVKSKHRYYVALGQAALQSWKDAFAATGILKNVPISSAASPEELIAALQRINEIIPTFDDAQVKVLMKTGLVKELHYRLKANADGTLSMLPMKQSFLDKIDLQKLDKRMAANLANFTTEYYKMNVKSDELKQYLDRIGIDEDSAIKSFFWNQAWVAHNFNSLHAGAIEQYGTRDEYSDMAKRASGQSTHRYRFVERDKNWVPDGAPRNVIEGRKLGQTSKTMIMNDFAVTRPSISYMGNKVSTVKVYDGLAFHNPYARLQMQASYGGNFGFQVGKNLKPISSFMRPIVGSSRLDKYASFEITPQMSLQGDRFIMALDRTMKSAIPFGTTRGRVEPIALPGGGSAANLFELETWARANNITEEQVMDIMVQNGVQDDYIQEVIFDSSVKTGASNINWFNSPEEFIQAASQPGFAPVYLERGNSERGLILDANKESDGADGTLSTQNVGAYLQHESTRAEGLEIINAINVIGNLERKRVKTDQVQDVVEPLLNKIKEQESANYISSIVAKGGVLPIDNIQILRKAFSAFASSLSDSTVGLKMAGGQQVLAPATGIFRAIDVNGRGILAGAAENQAGTSRELHGFDAFKDGKSVLDTPIWKALKEAHDAKRYDESAVLRQQLYQELSNGWVLQQAECVVSPIHFSKFNIPKGAQIPDVTPDSLAEWNLRARFRKSWIKEEGDIALWEQLVEERKAIRNNTALDPQQQAVMLNEVEQKFDLIKTKYITSMKVQDAEKYVKMYDSFLKTLDILLGRIPGTTIHSILPMTAVGFAWDADNRVHVHPDVLIYQGADQDIDKGNILAFDPDQEGLIEIPSTVEDAGRSVPALKNLIVQKMWDASMKPGAAIISTMPTATQLLDEKLAEFEGETNEYQSEDSPVSVAQKYAEGQLAKNAVATLALGLKTYNGLVYSSSKTGKSYDAWTPKSPALYRGGNPMALVDNINSLQFFDEFIQAALDNAKDPKLAKAAMNPDNAQVINTLGLYGYTPSQVVDFIRHPLVREVFIKYAEQKELKYVQDFVAPLEFLKNFAETNPAPELEDLGFLMRIGRQFSAVGTIFSLNKEVANNFFEAYKIRRAFNDLTGGKEFNFEKFADIINDPAERKKMSDNWNARFGGSKERVNIMEVLEDNQHMLSYFASFVLAHKTFRDKSKMYDYLFRLVDTVSWERITDEAKFNSVLDFIYGMAVDSYLRDRQVTITLDGKVYDLGVVGDTEENYGRVSFMRDVPYYFTPESGSIRPKTAGSVLEYLTQMSTEDGTIIKPWGNLRDYPDDRKAMAMQAMTLADQMLEYPAGDTSPNRVLFYYSLIKDKGAMSGTSFTEMFNYDTRVMGDFDNYVHNSFAPTYFVSPDSTHIQDLELILKMSSRFSWQMSLEELELLKSKEMRKKQEAMQRNRISIPYSSNSALNGLITADSFKGRVVESRNIVVLPVIVEFTKGKWVDPQTGKEVDPDKLPTAQNSIGETMVWSKKQNSYVIKSEKDREDEEGERTFSSEETGYDDNLIYKAHRNRISHGMLTKFAEMLGQRFGVPVQVMTTAQMIDNYGPSRAKAKGLMIESSGTVIINSDKVTIDTPIHEISHVFMLALQREKPELFRKIIDEALAHDYAKTIRAKYPEETDEYIGMEVFATLAGMQSANKVVDFYNRNWFTRMKDTLREFFNWLAEKLNFSPIFDRALSVNDSLMSLIDKVGESAVSALRLTSNEMTTLDMLGIRLVPANQRLMAIRNRLRAEKRVEKICD
jgi:hypothetical protein